MTKIERRLGQKSFDAYQANKSRLIGIAMTVAEFDSANGEIIYDDSRWTGQSILQSLKGCGYDTVDQFMRQFIDIFGMPTPKDDGRLVWRVNKTSDLF